MLLNFMTLVAYETSDMIYLLELTYTFYDVSNISVLDLLIIRLRPAIPFTLPKLRDAIFSPYIIMVLDYLKHLLHGSLFEFHFFDDYMLFDAFMFIPVGSTCFIAHIIQLQNFYGFLMMELNTTRCSMLIAFSCAIR